MQVFGWTYKWARALLVQVFASPSFASFFIFIEVFTHGFLLRIGTFHYDELVDFKTTFWLKL
jgi:hypothetical protein